MIDIQLVREKREIVKDHMMRKLMDGSVVDKLFELDQKYRDLLQDVESLRARRNQMTKDTIEEAAKIKIELKEKEPQLDSLKLQCQELLMQIPNLVHYKTPKGKTDDDNVEHRKVGTIRDFGFKPLDHLTLANNLDLVDFDTGAKVSGSQFYYLKNELVLLEQALINYALQFLFKNGFVPMATPDLAKSRFYLGTGYLPRGDEAQTYMVEGEDLGLIATAEVTLAGYHADSVLNYKDLPKKYVGISHCYRKEAGAYGKYSKGLYRVHQFTKIEMFAYTTPEQSDVIHQQFLEMEEKLWQGLGIPYRVLEMCDADLGGQAVRKFDLEAWMPGKGENGEWGEVTSTSNTTDYQSRNLNIKFKNEQGENEYAHTLNGTAIATSRGMIAVLENYQQEDGSILIPEALQSFMGGMKVISR